MEEVQYVSMLLDMKQLVMLVVVAAVIAKEKEEMALKVMIIQRYPILHMSHLIPCR
jgi:hypothetical protein